MADLEAQEGKFVVNSQLKTAEKTFFCEIQCPRKLFYFCYLFLEDPVDPEYCIVGVFQE